VEAGEEGLVAQLVAPRLGALQTERMRRIHLGDRRPRSALRTSKGASRMKTVAFSPTPRLRFRHYSRLRLGNLSARRASRWWLVGGSRLLFSNSTSERLDPPCEMQTRRRESTTKSATGTQQFEGEGNKIGAPITGTRERVAIKPGTGVIRSKSSERMG
jgi:hypothetical protein